MFSCDVNKIKVGTLAVSRYHQLEKRYYPVDDAPNYPDHDFLVPGYHIIASGYMRLVNDSFTSTFSRQPHEFR